MLVVKCTAISAIIMKDNWTLFPNKSIIWRIKYTSIVKSSKTINSKLFSWNKININLLNKITTYPP